MTGQVLTFAERWQASPAPGGGLIGLFDHYLRLLGEEGAAVEFSEGRCWLSPRQEGDAPEELPLSRTTFRPILARVAFLCNEYRPSSVTPYGGVGVFKLAGPPELLLRVSFTNTPDIQKLDIRPAGAPAPALNGTANPAG